METFEKSIKEQNLRQQLRVESEFDLPIEESIEKARSGIYKPTKENLKQGRAGERYGSAVHGGSTQIVDHDYNKKIESVVKFLIDNKIDEKFGTGPNAVSTEVALKQQSFIEKRFGIDHKQFSEAFAIVRKKLVEEKPDNKYSSNQLSNAILGVFPGKKPKAIIELTSDLKRKSKDANEKQFTWNDINDHLTKKGWSPRHILMLMDHLKGTKRDNKGPILKAFEEGLLSYDVFEKGFGKKAEIGEVRDWHGVKMKKVSNTGNSKQDWQPIKESGEKEKKEPEPGEGKMNEADLKEHAKQASEQALSNAIKTSQDPTVRQVAHQELERRKKEEAVQEKKEEFPNKDAAGGEKKKEDKKSEKKEFEKISDPKLYNEIKGLDVGDVTNGVGKDKEKVFEIKSKKDGVITLQSDDGTSVEVSEKKEEPINETSDSIKDIDSYKKFLQENKIKHFADDRGGRIHVDKNDYSRIQKLKSESKYLTENKDWHTHGTGFSVHESKDINKEQEKSKKWDEKEKEEKKKRQEKLKSDFEKLKSRVPVLEEINKKVNKTFSKEGYDRLVSDYYDELIETHSTYSKQDFLDFADVANKGEYFEKKNIKKSIQGIQYF